MRNDVQNRVVEASLDHAPGSQRSTVSGTPAAVAPPKCECLERRFQEGLIAGLLGYMVVALFFAVVTMLDRQSLFSVSALLRGTLFFQTGPGAAAMVVTGPPIAYAGPRLVTFLVAGVFMACLASLERAPKVWLVAFMMLLFIAAPVMGIPILFDEKVEAAVSPWLVTTATSLAVLAMASYLWILHPVLRAALQQGSDRLHHS